MNSKETNPWKTINSKKVYSNPWIDVHHREVINPAGNDGIYGVVNFKNIAVGVVPLDENYNTWIVGQYRYTLDVYSWEIPEGGCIKGTDPLDAAKRELKEETGIRANKWTEIMQMYTSNSVCDEKAIIYIAKDLEFGTATPEDTEDLQTKKIAFSELLDMTMNGLITDAMSVAAILKTNLLIKSNKV